MIALLAAALVAELTFHKASQDEMVRTLAAGFRVVGKPVPEGMARIADHGELDWYAFLLEGPQQMDWGRDTIQVETSDGRVLRAREQFAMTPDMRVIRLSGQVDLSDAHRVASGQAVIVCGFRGRLSKKSVQSIQRR